MRGTTPKILTLVSGYGWHVQDLRRAAVRVGVGLDAAPFASLVGPVGIGGETTRAQGRSVQGYDGVLVRMMPPGTLEQVVFRMDVLQRIASSGVDVMNPPRAVEVAVDKYLSLALLEAAGVPVPPTVACESARDALEAFASLGGDVVVKPLFGSEGRGLIRVESLEMARRAFATIERLGAVLYLQKFVPNAGHDFRAFVLDGEVIGAIRRHAPGDDWRTNVSIGGRAEAVALEPGMQKIATVAAGAVGARMAGVDVVVDREEGGPVVLEVNAVPGWRALARETGVDVAAAILERFRKA